MPKLSDLQLVLLSAAAQRDNRSLLPKPASIKLSGAALTNALAALLKSCLVEEGQVSDPALAYRTEGDVHFGLRITKAGEAALGLGDEPEPSPSELASVSAPTTPRSTKASQVLELLRRDEGATLDDLVNATGWLQHTTRAALTGLRKKGYSIERGKRGDVTCYYIAPSR